MKKIYLAQDVYALVDKEDYPKASQHKWYYRSGYVEATINGQRIFLHRFIMNTPPNMWVDHVNGDGLDNRKFNLRNCTQSQNMMNSRKQSRPLSSRYKGVSLEKETGKWRTYVNQGRKRIWIGDFNSEAHAAVAYDLWAVDMYGEFARTNLPGIRSDRPYVTALEPPQEIKTIIRYCQHCTKQLPSNRPRYCLPCAKYVRSTKVRYRDPIQREKIKAANKKWQEENREYHLAKMREYGRAYYHRKKLANAQGG